MKKWITDIICGLLIVLWVYAATSKLTDVNVFTEQLKRQPIPESAVGILIWILPAGELIIALLLSSIKTRTYGLLLSLILMTVFTLYVGLALSGAYGSIPCSCGGIFFFLQWKGHLVFNTVVTLAAFIGWKLSRKEMNVSRTYNQRYYAHIGKKAENP
jgi:membrane protein implicated in regulation of membrane protease activity